MQFVYTILLYLYDPFLAKIYCQNINVMQACNLRETYKTEATFNLAFIRKNKRCSIMRQILRKKLSRATYVDDPVTEPLCTDKKL